MEEDDQATAPIMEPSVWENLGPDMLMKVLAHLPSPSCLRFRTVCKGWKIIIDSPQFLDFCSEMWMERPWFLVFQRLEIDAVHMYDPRDRKWYTFPLSFLPIPVCGRAAAGSLLCVEEREDTFFKALYICDPLAKTWIKLPPMMEETYWRSRSVTLMVDEFVGAFKVLVGCNFRLQVYDSLSTSWDGLGQAPRQRLGQAPTISAGYCRLRSTLYCLSPSLGFDIVPQPYQLLSFNMDEERWMLVNIKMPKCLTYPHLTENEDHSRIMMVGGVWKKKMVRSLRIWELNLEKHSWDKVARVPDRHWKQLAAGNWNTACAWSGEWISIASLNRVLAYNLSNGEWVLSPPSGADPTHGPLMSIFPFKPAFGSHTRILEPPNEDHIGVPMDL
ncbi:unnamed protein product [Calypogeia fissa]